MLCLFSPTQLFSTVLLIGKVGGAQAVDESWQLHVWAALGPTGLLKAILAPLGCQPARGWMIGRVCSTGLRATVGLFSGEQEKARCKTARSEKVYLPSERSKERETCELPSPGRAFPPHHLCTASDCRQTANLPALKKWLIGKVNTFCKLKVTLKDYANVQLAKLMRSRRR